MDDDILNKTDGEPRPPQEEAPKLADILNEIAEQTQEEPAAPSDPPAPQPPKKRGSGSIVKNVLIIGAFVLFFTVGLIVMLYPSISNYINNKNQSRVVQTYRDAVVHLDETDYESYLAAARDYNARLSATGGTVSDAFISAEIAGEQTGEYWDLLSINDSGIMGYVVIDILDIEVPLYHGTGDLALAIGAGHLQGTSLPVGGESTHTAVSAHTGLPSAKFFDGIDRLEIGDTFALHVMNEIFTYQIDQILVVLPEEVDALGIEPGQDYATLVTCTPYGINSHRLLVRGTRIETPPEQLEAAQAAAVAGDQAPGLLGQVGNAIVVGLANVVEAVAQTVVDVAEWAMDILGVSY